MTTEDTHFGFVPALQMVPVRRTPVIIMNCLIRHNDGCLFSDSMYTGGCLTRYALPPFRFLSVDVLASMSLRDPYTSCSRRLVMTMLERVSMSLIVEWFHDAWAPSWPSIKSRPTAADNS